MINFKDRVWPSDYKNHGLLVGPTASLVYQVYTAMHGDSLQHA